MFWFIIANPAAGNGTVKQIWPQLEHQLQEAGISYSIQFSQYPGHATQLAQNALLKGHRYLLGLGGDGTHHEIANGILSQQEIPPQEILYAPFPVGTGNDWARQYQIPHEPISRIKNLLNPFIIRQDVGKVNYLDPKGSPSSRWFINVAGLAYDGFIAKKLEENGKSNSQLVYLLAIAKYLFQYNLSEAIIRFDPNNSVQDYFYTINIGICKYSGGGMQLVPHAIPNDGLLALTFASKMPKWEVLLQTARFYNGTLLSHPKVTGVQTKNIEITPTDPSTHLWLEADGEFLGLAPATFQIVPGLLSIVT